MAVTLANLISYWNQESLGIDVHGSNDLTNINSPTQTPGIIGDAVQFVRASAQHQQNTNSELSMTGHVARTISMWAQLDSKPAGIMRLWSGVVAGSTTFFLLWDNTVDRFSLRANNGVTFISVNNTSAPSLSTWIHLVGTHDPDNDLISLWVNGTRFDSASFTAGFRTGIWSYFDIGSSGSSEFWDGPQDEISYWNEVPSDAQVLQWYNSGAGLSYAETRALFDVTVTPTAVEAVADTSGPISVITPSACGVSIIPQPFAGDYQLYFVDPADGSPIDLVPMSPRLHSLKYQLKLNDVGEIRFTVDAADRLVQRIIGTEDILCDVLRRNAKDQDFEVEKTFFIRYWDLFEEDNNRESVIFAGVSLEDLLRRRIIVPSDDPLGAAGFSTKSGFADLVMSEFVRDQAVNPFINMTRKFPEFYLTPFSPDSLHMAYQRVKQENTLLQVLQDIANTSNMDFQIFRNGGRRLEFLPSRIGEDRTAARNEFQGRPYVLFSDKRANIQEPRLTYDRRKESTYMFVAGPGIEEDRVYVPVGSTRSVASPYNRIEALIDSRDDDSIDQILATGSAEIQRQLGKRIFDWKVAFGQAQTRYNVDWSLGDRVSASYQDIFENFRLIEMNIEVKADGETLSPVFEQEL